MANFARNNEIERKYFDELGLEIYNEKEGDITLYSCPECNEGTSYGIKHRFHWKYDNNRSYVNCFNCSFAMDFEYFIKHSAGDDKYRELMSEYGRGKEKETFLNENKVFESLINSPRTLDHSLKSLGTNVKILKYLEKRKLLQFKDIYLTDKYNNIVIPFYNKNNKLYGYQTRIIENKQFWFELDKINIKFRAWNFYGVDWEKPVYIFEGVEDALSSGLDNVMAVMGKYVSDFIISKLKNPILCFDNDMDGKKAMYRQVNKFDCKAILYPNDFKYKDMNEMLCADNNTLETTKAFILKNTKNQFRVKMLAKTYMV